MNKRELVLAISERIVDKIITDGEVTNGDVFTVMFPDCQITDLKNGMIRVVFSSYCEYFEKSWWDAQYKI